MTRFARRAATIMASVALVIAVAGILWSTMRALGQCERVQLLRDQDNRESAVIYRTLSTVAAGAARAPDPAARERARYYALLADQVSWTPPTDCQAAALNPLGYEAPRPIRFDDLPRRRLDALVPPPK